MEKVNKRVIVIIILMAIIAPVITAVLIIENSKITKNEEHITEKPQETIQEESQENNITRLKLTDMYNENDLIIEDIEENVGKIEIKYIKISGLKNKNIEEKVNKLIKEKVNDLVSQIPAEGYDSVYINGYVSANFSNILSVCIGGYVSPYTEEINLDSYGINIDLTTGNTLKIKDLFNSNNDFYTALRNQIYLNKMSEIEDLGYWIYDDMPEYEDTIASIKEKQLSLDEDVLNDFMKIKSLINENTNFYFSNNYINFIGKDFSNILYGISLKKNYKYVAIYTKYLTNDSIFEKDNIGMKNRFVFSFRRDNMYYSYQEKLLDNLYIDIIIANMNYEEVEDKVDILEQVKEKYSAKIEELKNEMKDKKEKAKAVFIYCGYNTLNEKYTLIYLDENYRKYEMSSDYYKNNFIYKIANASSTSFGGGIEDEVYIYLDDEAKNEVTLKEDELNYFWNTKSNTEVKKSSDIFKSEELYENAMQTFLKEKWQEKYGVLLSPEELIEKNKSTSTELSKDLIGYDGKIIIFKNSELGKYRTEYGYDWDYGIGFSYFDENALNIMK